jgi:hypothetical protein
VTDNASDNTSRDVRPVETVEAFKLRIAAINLLEPHVERFWNDVRSVFLAGDETSDGPLKHQKSVVVTQHQNSDASSKHGLINQHMILAGFAIENLCMGYLVGRLNHEEQKAVRVDVLPKSLQGHNSLDLVGQTGVKMSDAEKDLVRRISTQLLSADASKCEVSSRPSVICANRF